MSVSFIYFIGEKMIIATHSNVKVINYVRLKKIENNIIVIQMNKYTLKIRGYNLGVSFFEKSEIQIDGQIEGIDYDYGK